MKYNSSTIEISTNNFDTEIKLKAAMFYHPKDSLKIEDIKLPEIQPNEVLVKVAACGVCTTEIAHIDFGVPTAQRPPVILGHEISGVVADTGSEVDHLNSGDRVLLPIYTTCGVCKDCRSGRENICRNMKAFGNHMNGGFAEYTKAPGKDAFKLPESIPLEEACIITDGLSTPYHAVKNRAKVQMGEWIAVYGCGAIGINLIQMAAAIGANVIAIDISENKLEAALKLGAAKVINANKQDPQKQIMDITKHGVDVAFESVGLPITVQQAYQSVRAGGRLCIVGTLLAPVELNFQDLIFKEIEITGVLGCNPSAYPEVIELVERNRVELNSVVTGRFALKDVNEAINNQRVNTGFKTIVIP